jgi:hypothetical protein
MDWLSWSRGMEEKSSDRCELPRFQPSYPIPPMRPPLPLPEELPRRLDEKPGATADPPRPGGGNAAVAPFMAGLP